MVRAEKRKYHYIYKITCKVTNRFYIGMHSTDNINDGYFGSGKRLWYSINYHGKETHVKEIIEYLPTRQLLKEREREIVNKDLLGEPLCMNLQEGGGGGFSSEEHKIKAQLSSKVSFRKHLENDNDFRAKFSLKQSEKMKKRHEEGKINYNTFLGKKHTEETKQKLRKVKNVGKTNSQFGTSWITKDGINKKIKKEDLNSFIQDGWIKGRK
jgi:hypothetical protein